MPEDKRLSVEIDGTPVPSYLQVMLKQTINTHHYFEITLDIETAETFSAGVPEVSSGWVGRKVVVRAGDRVLLIGVATRVGLHRSDGTHGNITVSGHSSTYLLEGGHTCASWCGRSLSDIVKELTDRAGVQALINPETKSRIEYECQYEETDFRFIQRLARQYREWLYFDGQSLVFGKPESGSVVPLTYGRGLFGLDVCSQLLGRPLSGSSYNATDDRTYSGKSPDKAAGLGELGQTAFGASMELFRIPAVQRAEPRTANKSELDAYFQRKQQSDSAASSYITAESDCPDLTVGSLVDVHSEAHTGVGVFLDNSIGTYIVTEINHVAGMGGSYRNYFTAIPASVPSLPCPDVPLPVAHTQQAVVVSNDDPRKLGRVQVRMNWQTGGMQTSWIRVLTPDAGTSDKVSSNRGFVFIPEKGDQVMVAFRYDDPNRPFVLGSLFHGKSGTGGGAGNKTKSLTTRSGSTVTLNDDDGSVTVKDKDGNSYVADGSGNITITASKSITLKVGDSSIVIDDSGNITVTANNDLTETANNNISQEAASAFNSSSGDSFTISATGEFSASSQKTALMSGLTKATVDSSGSTEITGTIVKLN